jgi:hypothetical protein
MKRAQFITLTALLSGIFILLVFQIFHTPKYEYRISHFDRDESSYRWRQRLEEFSNERWEYAGTICNNGINARYVLFKKKVN